jgi:DNA-binding NarL/FixJ family response regulator
MTDEPLRVGIVDDHAMYRRGLRSELEVDPAIVVVGEYSTADAAVDAIPEVRPDVTLMDLHMPRRKGDEPTYCGADAITRIRQVWSEAAIVVLTMYRDDERVREAIRAGARGYLLKEDESIDFASGVRLVASGKGIFDGRVVQQLSELVPLLSNGIRRPFPELTNRQFDVLEFLALGKSNREIATSIGIEPKTVENYLPLIYDRLRVENRQEAITKARAAGLGPPPDGSNPPKNGGARTP